MCGISAIVYTGTPPAEVPIEAMTAVIRHRGPDDEGYALFPDDGPIRVALGHRRLSVIDLSPAGHQPMCHGPYWIVYNGEIYNYRELRADLEALGHAFSTETDTEVLLHAYAEWGRDCLARLNGMFAFVLYDREAETVFAARDRFGVKPLYYWFSPEGFLAFASEIKQFTVLPGWEARLNHQRAFDYLAYSLQDHTQETMFAGVMQLRGGEAAEVGQNPLTGARLLVYRWYDFQPDRSRLEYAGACARFRELFTDSVRLRLRADVPVGSCLSGGLDSSSIVCVANDLLKAAGAHDRQRTFSVTSDSRRVDESEYIRAVVEARGVEGHVTCPSVTDLLGELDEIVWHQDEPFGSTSIYAQWSVFRLAAETGMTVMLDGQGADELLCGYHHAFSTRYADLFRAGRWPRLYREMARAEREYGYPRKQALIEMAFYLLPDGPRQAIQRARFGHLLTPAWLETSRLEAGLRLNEVLPPTHTVEDGACTQTLYSSLPALLHWEDRNSMAHSIESRVPFLDYRLAEFVMGLPTDYKLRDCRTKMVLRDGLEGILPERIRERRDKVGFATAEAEWIRSEPELFRGLAREAIVGSFGILNGEAGRLFEEVASGVRDHDRDRFVWRWICFARWLRVFGVRP